MVSPSVYEDLSTLVVISEAVGEVVTDACPNAGTTPKIVTRVVNEVKVTANNILE